MAGVDGSKPRERYSDPPAAWPIRSGRLARVALLAMALASTACREAVTEAPAVETEGVNAGETPASDGLRVDDSTDAASRPTARPALLPELDGRLIFERIEPGGRHPVLALDAATGEVTELWSATVDDTQLALDWRPSPDGSRLAYRLGSPERDALVIRRLAVGAEPELTIPAPERGHFDGLHWSADGSTLVAGVNVMAADGIGIPRPEAFEIRAFATNLEPEGRQEADANADAEPRLRLEGDALDDQGWSLAAWDEATGNAALLNGPGEGGWVDQLRLVEVASARELARWETGGEGYRYAAGPRVGWPGASWLALVDEREAMADPTAASHLRLVDLELPRGAAEEDSSALRILDLAEVPAGVRATDLTWSAAGDLLAWSEAPDRSGTGLRQRIRFVHIGGDVGPATVLPEAEGLAAIPLAFEPALPGAWPRLLAGDGIYDLGAMNGIRNADGAVVPIRSLLPWPLPPVAEDIFPQNPLAGLGRLVAWLPLVGG